MTLQVIGHRDFQAVAKCHANWYTFQCDDNHLTYKPTFTCHNRACPWCQASRANRLKEAYLHLSQEAPNHRLRYVVLTIPSTPKLDFSDLRKKLVRLQRTVWWKARVLGGAYAFETTWNPFTKWHPHINLVVELRPSCDFDADDLRSHWDRITDGGRQVWVSYVNGKTWDEMLKYTFKGTAMVYDPSTVVEYLDASKGLHLATAFGSWWGRSYKEEPASPEERYAPPSCRTCSHPTRRLLLTTNVLSFLEGTPLPIPRPKVGRPVIVAPHLQLSFLEQLFPIGPEDAVQLSF